MVYDSLCASLCNYVCFVTVYVCVYACMYVSVCAQKYAYVPCGCVALGV